MSRPVSACTPRNFVSRAERNLDSNLQCSTSRCQQKQGRAKVPRISLQEKQPVEGLRSLGRELRGRAPHPRSSTVSTERSLGIGLRDPSREISTAVVVKVSSRSRRLMSVCERTGPLYIELR